MLEYLLPNDRRRFNRRVSLGDQRLQLFFVGIEKMPPGLHQLTLDFPVQLLRFNSSPKHFPRLRYQRLD